MANSKVITMDYSVNGLTVYCLVRREADSYLLDDSDGSFTASPTDYFISMPEDGVIAGRYEVSESRTVWDNGLYTVCIYQQSGASPFPAADTMIGDGELVIQDDTEISNWLSSVPWTGTTTVQQILDQVLPRLKTASFSLIDGINTISNLIFKRLWTRKSDIVTAEIAISFANGVQAMATPTSFFGIKDFPYIPGVGELDKIDPRQRYYYQGKTGTPEVYDMRQNTLYVYPTPIELTTVKMRYFRNPGTVASLADVVPFTGMFNHVYIEGLVNFNNNSMGYTQDNAFAGFVNNEIDSVLPVRNIPLRTIRSANYF